MYIQNNIKACDFKSRTLFVNFHPFHGRHQTSDYFTPFLPMFIKMPHAANNITNAVPP